MLKVLLKDLPQIFGESTHLNNTDKKKAPWIYSPWGFFISFIVFD